jgi:hypothetical protein
MSEGFWERKVAAKRAEEQPASTMPSARSSDPPWWAQGTRLVPATQVAGQGVLELPGIVDGHDVSKAQHLKKSGFCPDCGSGNYMTPPGSKMTRCFDCGYNTAREYMHPSAGFNAVSEGPAQKARQVDAGGGITHNYHGNITSAGQAAGRL